MSRIQKTKKERIVVDILTATFCDLCGIEGESTCSPDETSSWGDGWGDGGYLVKETAVYCESGVNYPDGGHSETASVDICPKCFEEKLMPWLQSQGANVRREELIY